MSVEAFAPIYRFSVRCDRDMNASIEKAAKAAGLSPTNFVQSHFETILTAEPARVQPVRPLAKGARADVDLAKSLGITKSALRVYRALDERVDHMRNVAITNSGLAEAAGVARPQVPGIVASLKARKLVQVFDRVNLRGATRYHVYSIGDER